MSCLCSWSLAYEVLQACELLLVVVTRTACFLLGPLGLGLLVFHGHTVPTLHQATPATDPRAASCASFTSLHGKTLPTRFVHATTN